MENIEIKIRLRDFAAVRAKLKELGARPCGTLVQRDTYFSCPDGRLKLREFPGKPAQLIHYRRPETRASRLSSFHILRIDQPRPFAAFMGRVMPVLVVVSKKRVLYYVESARIHLDEVSGLGRFLEIESEVKKSRPAARALMARLMREFGINSRDCLRKSYSDLLLLKKAS